MKLPRPVCVDFETLGIQDRPAYPPVPVGVAVRWPGKRSRYWAWGHPTANNCSLGEALAELRRAWAHPGGLLFQNGKFDVDVAETHLGLPLPAWDRIHDTLFLLFLDDPHQPELGLKPAAARLLGLPPEERDAVGDWLVARQPIPGVKIGRSLSSDHYYGRYLAHAPGDLVGQYACGDTDRTAALFDLLWPRTRDRGMLAAYDRERRLMPILLEMERQGLPVDLPRLRQDVAEYTAWFVQVDTWLRRKLKADLALNLDSGDQLVAAMVAAGLVDERRLPLTKTGKRQTNKDALLAAVDDPALLVMLRYRAALKTCLGTFMRSWLEMAEASGGLVFTTWHQVRGPKGDGTAGTRTGRLSATWFMNMPKEFVPLFRHEEMGPKKARGLPVCPIKGLPSLPQVRRYITPFPGHVLLDRDYSQQEPRILGHFDGGQLLRRYQENPWTDVHDFARDELAKAGKIYDRRPVKDTNLGLIYGMGAPKLAAKTGLPVEETKVLRQAVLNLYPGLKEMYKDMKRRAQAHEPVRTWGGREYYCEEPKIIDGRIREFDYKLVNVLIQGSAADCTKEAIIRYHAVKHPEAKILLNVHDQVVVSVPARLLKSEMEVLRGCLEGIEFDVQMLTEGAVSRTNWAEVRDYDKRGVLV